MELHVEWARSITLEDGSSRGTPYVCDMDRIAEKSGVYIFGRKFGEELEVFYIGKAQSLRARIRTQLNNARLMTRLQQARNGKRVLLIGVFKARPGQQQDNCLKVIEKSLIRHFLSEGHDLVNVQGTILRQHEIKAKGAGKMLPRTMFVDR